MRPACCIARSEVHSCTPSVLRQSQRNAPNIPWFVLICRSLRSFAPRNVLCTVSPKTSKPFEGLHLFNLYRSCAPCELSLPLGTPLSNFHCSSSRILPALLITQVRFHTLSTTPTSPVCTRCIQSRLQVTTHVEKQRLNKDCGLSLELRHMSHTMANVGSIRNDEMTKTSTQRQHVKKRTSE